MIVLSKLSFDGRVTRNHWYPKWILFARHQHERALVRRTTMGQVMCDLAIDLGFGIPISRKHNSVCDAMEEIKAFHQGHCAAFYSLLMSSNQDKLGWVEFLKVVANTTAETLLCTEYRDLWSQDDIRHGVASWYSWYIQNRQHLECCDSHTNSGGNEFLRAMEETEGFIQFYMMLLLGFRI